MFGEIVRIRGLPFEANALSIVEFFECQVEEYCIHFIQDRPGGNKPHSGEAFVDCENADTLLKYHKKHMGARYVEVLPSSKAEKHKYRPKLISMPVPQGVIIDDEDKGGKVDSYRMPAGAGRPASKGMEGIDPERIIKARGLPFDAETYQVAELFQQYGVDESHTFLDLHQSGPRQGKPTGMSYIVFENEEMRNQALKECEGVLLGSRYLELFGGVDRDSQVIARKPYADRGGYGGPGNGYAGGYSGYGGGYGGGYGKGESFNNFHTYGGPSRERSPRREHRGGSGHQVRLWGLSFKATEDDIVDFFAPDFHITAGQITMGTGRDGRPSGEAFVDLDSPEACESARAALDRKDLLGRYVEVFVVGGSKGMGKAMRGRGIVPRPPPMNDRGAASGGYYGWLRLRGLPYDVTVSDIVQFMGFNFPVSDNDISLENSYGRPTGQAFVRLPSREVEGAIRALDKQNIGSRYVEVYESSFEEATRRGPEKGKGKR